MMLITLIENSFKHGVMKTAGKAWIKMSVDCSSHTTTIQISNSGRPAKQGTGIGLSNLRSQLDHLYPEKYSLQIDSDRADQFSVRLVLNS
jgi:LytS/YehU family sensor histidine kinase